MTHIFPPFLDPSGTQNGPPRRPKEIQNSLKSAKIAPKRHPKRVWRRSLEKVASRTLPETSPYASRTVPAMVFTLPRRCPRAPFGLHFASVLGAFWRHFGHPKSPKERKRSLHKKHQKTCIQQGAEKSQK